MQDVENFINNETDALKYLVNEVFKKGYDYVETLKTELNGTIYLYFYKSKDVSVTAHNNNKLITLRDKYGDTISIQTAFNKKWIYVVRLSDHISKSSNYISLDVILNNGNYAVFEKDVKNLIKLCWKDNKMQKTLLITLSVLLLTACNGHAIQMSEEEMALEQARELELHEEYDRFQANVTFGTLPESYTQEQVKEMLKQKPLQGE